MKQISYYSILLLLTFSVLSSCQFRRERKQLEELSKMIIEQQNDSLNEEKQQKAEAETARLDSLRGYPLEPSKSSQSGKKMSYNTAVFLAVLIGVIFFSLLSYRLIKGFKTIRKNYSYATGEIKSKVNELMNDPEKLDKLSPEERIQFEKMSKFINNKQQKN